MDRLRIYVAGPAASRDIETVKTNIEQARKIGEKILELGHLPYVPHTHFSQWSINIHDRYEQLQEHGESILEKWANALFYIAPSPGADRERKIAEKKGLRIFTRIEEIPPYA